MDETRLLQREDVGFPDVGREQFVNEEADFVEQYHFVHDEFVALHDGVDVGLDVKFGKSDVLVDPPKG